jgi:DNA-binding IclR family transcriptional regulator
MRAAMTDRARSLLGKVELILDALARHGGTMGLSELARSSSVPKSSVHRICIDLIEWGVVERNGDGFRLGPRLFDLGARVPTRRRFRDTALPFMEELLSATGHSIHLAVPLPDMVLYVDKLVARSSTPTPSSVTSTAPFHASATGKAMLAFGDPEWTRRILSGPLPAMTSKTLIDPLALAEDLARARSLGYAVEHEEMVEGFASMAAPLIGLGGAVVGAISVTTSVESLDPATSRLVCTTAASISQRLGAPSPSTSRTGSAA